MYEGPNVHKWISTNYIIFLILGVTLIAETKDPCVCGDGMQQVPLPAQKKCTSRKFSVTFTVYFFTTGMVKSPVASLILKYFNTWTPYIKCTIAK